MLSAAIYGKCLEGGGARTIELIFDDGLSTPYGVGRACLLEVCGQLLATRLVSVGVADLT